MKKIVLGMSVLSALSSGTAWAELTPLPYQYFADILSRAIRTGDDIHLKHLPSYLCSEPNDVQVALTYLTESRSSSEILYEARCIPFRYGSTIRLQKIYSYSVVAKDSCYAYVEVIVDSRNAHTIVDNRDVTKTTIITIKNKAHWVVRTNVAEGQCPS